MGKKSIVRKENFNKECEWLFKKKIYHRGYYDNKAIYENTIESYKKAVESNGAIELDVQLTNDLQVICFHDTSLKRFFNRERDVKDISYKRMNKIREDIKVPLLKDVLKLVEGKAELVIEFKSVNSKYNKNLIKKVYELLKDYNGKYVVVSFNPFMLYLYKKLDKKAYIGMNGSKKTRNIFERLVVEKHCFNWLLQPDFISYDIDNFDDKRLEKYKNKGYKIIGWTLKNDNKKELKKYFDNFIIEKK